MSGLNFAILLKYSDQSTAMITIQKSRFKLHLLITNMLSSVVTQSPLRMEIKKTAM